MKLIITEQQFKKLTEDPDEVFLGIFKKNPSFRSPDAIAFGMDGGYMYVGYNGGLFSNKYGDGDGYNTRYPTHHGMRALYIYLVKNNFSDNPITRITDTDEFIFPGRLWIKSKIVSFWDTPEPSQIMAVMFKLKDELKKIYDYDLNIKTLKIEVSNNKVMPITNYVEHAKAPEKITPKIHLMPSDIKMDMPQMKAAKQNNLKILGDKFKNVSQAEWNNAKKKFQGEAKINKIIGETVRKAISEAWFHGSPDAREISAIGGFGENKTSHIRYVNDPKLYEEFQTLLNKYHTVNEKMYLQTLNNPKYKNMWVDVEYKKPVFLSNKHAVANTYAKDKWAYDYQNATPKTFEVTVEPGKTLTIYAQGERFSGIPVDNLKDSLKREGVDENEINDTIDKFIINIKQNRIKTDCLGYIANQIFGFEIVDVVGVLDSYNGGNTPSTVRMVFDPKKIKIIN